MTQANDHDPLVGWQLLAALLLVCAIFWPGLYGTWLFDDYPNIVDNKGVQPSGASIPALLNAALSSPASELKRPLASLTFAGNFLWSGLDPFWMKLTNLLIHMLNGILAFWFVRGLLQYLCISSNSSSSADVLAQPPPARSQQRFSTTSSPALLALLIATAWMLLPINLTAVLYVVQRMESLANVFVLLGLIGYIRGRRTMLSGNVKSASSSGFLWCVASIFVPTIVGATAKETAVMLPLYTLLIELCIFRFRPAPDSSTPTNRDAWDLRLVIMYITVLAFPILVGLGYLMPKLVEPVAWSTRGFTMTTRLLTEARVVVSYIGWILTPTPSELSFYHDDLNPSTSLLKPWTTLLSIVCLLVLVVTSVKVRHKHPLISLGLALFLGSHLLTGTVLPLELVYEHRNYFGSLGLMIAVMPTLASWWRGRRTATHGQQQLLLLHFPSAAMQYFLALLPASLLMIWWASQTAATAYAWGDPLRLARELARRGPESPRAQYELGRTYIIYSRYQPGSAFIPLAYASLEKAASLPKSSILPQQALIFMNARMGLPVPPTWWESMIAKLKTVKPGVQDESALIALAHCMRYGQCDLPKPRMSEAFEAAIDHPDTSARLLAAYGEFAWLQLGDIELGEQMTAAAVRTAPGEAIYHINLLRILVAQKRYDAATQQWLELQHLNIGGYLDKELAAIRPLLPATEIRR